MAFVKEVQRSRPLQLALAAVGSIFFYIFFLRSSSAGDGAGSYTNEELNTILQGDEKSELNEFNIYKREITDLEIESPYMSATTLELINYVNRGNTLISNDKIRLISDKPHQAGSLFSKKTIPADHSFQMELQFSINGAATKNGLYGDGLAIWLTDGPLQGGEVFGVENRWNGAGLFIDTYQNNADKSAKTTGFPYASLQLNNGEFGKYDKGTDGAQSEVVGCSLSKVHNVRTGKSKMRLIYLRESGYLSVDFDVRSNGNWKNCFTVDAGVVLPENTHIGFSGETGDLSHNVDIFALQIYSLFDDENQAVKSIKAINDDLNFHLKQEEAAAMSEKDDVVQSKARQRVIKKQTSAKARQHRRRTLTRLHKAEKRIKQKNAAANREKYDGHESFFSYAYSKLKSIMFWCFIATLLYSASIIVRAYLARRKLKRGSYYKGGLLD